MASTNIPPQPRIAQNLPLQHPESAWSWRDTYRRAMLEGRKDQIQERVESARQAIKQRIAELDLDPQPHTAECLDLLQAMRFLSLLLSCSATDGGRLLWN